MQINFKAYTGSMNDGVSPLIHPAEQPELLLGCTNSYKIGKITKDTGYSEVQTAAQAGKSIGGLYHFRQSPTVKKMLKTVDDATSDDTQLFYSDTGAWTEIAAAESAWQGFAGAKVEMETFIGYCFLVGHSAADGYLPSASLTNTTFSTSTNVTNMPRAKYIAKWDSKIFIANCRQGSTDHPYRVYYSSIPEAGAITWTVATDFFDLPDFSDEITGIVEMWNKLIIFTEYKTYFYDGSSLIKTPWQMGCSSHRTIQKHGNYLVWANVDGVWVSTGGAASKHYW